MKQKLNVNILLSILIFLIFVWFLRNGSLPVNLEIRRFMWLNNLTEGVVILRQDGQSDIIMSGKLFPLENSDYIADEYFPLASLSKPITASAVRKLISTGKLSLHDKLTDLLPELSMHKDTRYKNITVQQLIQHTAGFDRKISGEDLFSSTGKIMGCDWVAKQIIHRPLDYFPGELISYSNTGYCLLQEILTRKMQMSFFDVVGQLVFSSSPSKNFSLGPPDTATEKKWNQFTPQEWRNLGAAGGWFAKGNALADFYYLDIRDSSIKTKPTAPYANNYYGLGWRVWEIPNSYHLTHYGSISGVFTFAMAFPDGRVALSFFRGSPNNPEKASMELRSIFSNL